MNLIQFLPNLACDQNHGKNQVSGPRHHYRLKALKSPDVSLYSLLSFFRKQHKIIYNQVLQCLNTYSLSDGSDYCGLHNASILQKHFLTLPLQELHPECILVRNTLYLGLCIILAVQGRKIRIFFCKRISKGDHWRAFCTYWKKTSHKTNCISSRNPFIPLLARKGHLSHEFSPCI